MSGVASAGSHSFDHHAAGLADSRLLLIAPALILIASITFNAGLAIVNANVMALSSSIVMLVEGLLTGAALGVALLRWRPEMAPMIVAMALIFLFGVVRSIATEELQPKYIRDLMIMPVFLLLGMASSKEHLARTVLAIHTVVLIVLAVEALMPGLHSKLFNIQDYYINTRGTRADQFYNTNSDLFISATRPDARYLPFITEERMSSVFLEPVSLGNYCSIIIAFTVSCFRRLGWPATIYLALTTVLLLFGCDGRLAVLASLIIAAAALITPYLPPFSAIIYLPGAVLTLFTAAALLGLKAGTDDFAGRLTGTVELLHRFDLVDFLGLSNQYVDWTVDSGLAYLIVTQSLPGLILLWTFIAWHVSERTIEQVRFTHALCLYLTLSMLVSFSLLTIKTAALLWFIQGALQSSGSEAGRDKFSQS
ncbi:polysaccharide biosynthesis protein GumE [Hyphomicrobium sp.]|uniref:polysaccharide biosynthesis protein GumE n=1 Tax=Hyphomicrobium sp. TaxID=82 RepID=UPI002D7740CA|nr:polysaccharide biosynthesis protein GumE [Hyphomicrobium sp.]HET6390230.1 polysaccharide biosynthesis protein GumE [Hyphomicrobium sp.]